MYLSRLALNPRNRQAQRELSDLYQLHRSIMQCFPTPLPPDERVLFRLDTDPRTDAPALLLQSIYQPDLSSMLQAGQGQYLLQPPDGPKAFNPALTAGQIVRFRLRANPTIKKQRDSQKNGNRVPLVRENEQIDWLGRKGVQHGFQVLRVQVSGKDNLFGWKREDEATHKVQVYVVQYDGLLQITDPIRFSNALAVGVGPAKGLGCGLLSLARAA